MRHILHPGGVENPKELYRLKVSFIVERLCQGLGRVDTRFVEDAVFGITESGSVRLTSVSRALDEDIPLHATHKRLSRNLAHPAVGEVLLNNLLELGTNQLTDDSLLVLYTMDLEKKYAEKMAFLGELDSDEGSRKGYEICEIVGAGSLLQINDPPVTTEGQPWPERDFIPLNQSLWSRSAPEFVGVSQHILELVEQIRERSGSKGIVVCSQRHDDRRLLQHWATSDVDRFIVRQRPDSELLYRNSNRPVSELIDQCETPYGATVFSLRGNEETCNFMHFGYLPVRIPEAPERPLFLVVVKGLDRPIALLTTEPMRRNRSVIQKIVEAYFDAWRVKMTSRYMKSDYQFSDVRVLTYGRLKNMAILLLAITYLDTLWPGGGATTKGVSFSRRHGERDLVFWHRIEDAGETDNTAVDQ